MAYTIGNLKTDLQGILNVIDLSKVSSPDSLIQRAARDLLLDVDPHELVRDQQLTSPVYNDTFYYAAPADLKGDAVIDMYKQGDRNDDTSFFQLRTAFDARRYKDDETFTVERINGTQFIRINRDLTNWSVLDRFSDSTDYTATSNISNIENDNLQWIDSGKSLKFDLDNTGADPTTATLTGTLETADISGVYDPEAAVFLWVYMPDASAITSVELNLGSSASNYWNDTETTAYSGTAFENGWNLLKFDPFGSETGTPDNTAVDYFHLDIVYNGTLQEEFRVDYMTIALGEFYRVKYYSKYMFTSSGVWTETISGDADTINLDTDSYNLLLYKCGSYFIQSQHDYNYKPNDSEADRFELRYRELRDQYKRRYKSERLRQQVVYYPYSNSGNTR